MPGTISAGRTSATARTTAQSLGVAPRTIAGHNPMMAHTPPTSSPKFRNCLRSVRGVRLASIELKFAPPIRVSLQRWLMCLFEHAVLEHEEIDLGPHEAAIGVRRRADYRL